MLSYKFLSNDIACIEIERLGQNIQESKTFVKAMGTDLTPALLHAHTS